MRRKTSTHICFRVPIRIKEILEIIADYRGISLSELFQSYAIQLAIQFDPRVLRDENVKQFIEKVFSNEENNVSETDKQEG